LSYQILINKFLNIEKEINLNIVASIIYLQTRFYIFRNLQKLEFKSQNLNSRVFNKKFLLLEIISFLVALIKLPIFIFKSNIHIFSEHARYQKINDIYVEPYSFLSQEKVLQQKHCLIRIGTIKNGINDIKVNNLNYLFVSQYQYQIFSICVGILFLPISLIVFYTLYRELSYYLPKKIFSKQYFLKILYYVGGNVISLIILLLLKPIRVNVTEAYNSNSCFIVAANMLKIKSYEFQHGIISKEHIGYSLSYNDIAAKKVFLPQYIYVWSEDWKSFIGLVTNENTKIIPWTYEYFYQFTKKYSVPKEKSIDILIIGQPSISNELKAIAHEISILKPHNKIVYKAHPKEIITDDDKINLTICNDNLYELLLNSEVVIGGFSTALLEAKSLGCIVVSIVKYVPEEYKSVLNYFLVVLLDDLNMLIESFSGKNGTVVNDEVSMTLAKKPINLECFSDNVQFI